MKKLNNRSMLKRVGAFLCMILTVASLFVVPLFAEDTPPNVQIDGAGGIAFWEYLPSSETGFTVRQFVKDCYEYERISMLNVRKLVSRRSTDGNGNALQGSLMQSREVTIGMLGGINRFYDARIALYHDGYSEIKLTDPAHNVVPTYVYLHGNAFLYCFSRGESNDYVRLQFNNHLTEGYDEGIAPFCVFIDWKITPTNTNDKVVISEPVIGICNATGGVIDSVSNYNLYGDASNTRLFDFNSALFAHTNTDAGANDSILSNLLMLGAYDQQADGIKNVQWYYPQSYIQGYRGNSDNALVWEEGYAAGKAAGFEEGKDLASSEIIATVDGTGKIINALFEAPYRFFSTWLDVELFGINLFSLLTWIVSIALVVAVFTLAKRLFF